MHRPEPSFGENTNSPPHSGHIFFRNEDRRCAPSDDVTPATVPLACAVLQLSSKPSRKRWSPCGGPPTRSTTLSHGLPQWGQALCDAPALMHGSTRASGNVAKWAPLKFCVGISHTERLFRPAGFTSN